MKYIVSVVLFVSILLLQSCGSTDPVTKEPTFTVDEQEFVLTPETSGLETAATARVPRLVVRLSIKSELDTSGQPTGKRYGQAAFFWTDVSRSNGGSNLGGIVGLTIRDPKDPDDTSSLSWSSTPIMTNSDLYKQIDYKDHLATTPAISFTGPLCVQISTVYLVSTNGYRFIEQTKYDVNLNATFVINFCQPSKTSSESDISIKRLQEVTFVVPKGKPFPFTQGIINSGSSIVNNVSVIFDIAYAIGFEFVEDKSNLFECSSERYEEIFLLRITCHASELKIGLSSLPIMFTTTDELQSWNYIFDVESRITSSNPDSNSENNYSLSVLMIGE